ncbi:hypothetical protein [Endozoicomonas numazuensis]|nr:hypothetical protein [Endozoicomonas numazuensis]
MSAFIAPGNEKARKPMTAYSALPLTYRDTPELYRLITLRR